MAELKIEQDALRDTITINGIRYARVLFEDFAATLPLGQPFALASRAGGVLSVERLYGLAATHEAATPNLESCDRCGKGQTWTTFPGQRCDCGGLYVPNPADGVKEVPRG